MRLFALAFLLTLLALRADADEAPLRYQVRIHFLTGAETVKDVIGQSQIDAIQREIDEFGVNAVIRFIGKEQGSHKVHIIPLRNVAVFYAKPIQRR